MCRDDDDDDDDCELIVFVEVPVDGRADGSAALSLPAPTAQALALVLAAPVLLAVVVNEKPETAKDEEHSEKITFSEATKPRQAALPEDL